MSSVVIVIPGYPTLPFPTIYSTIRNFQYHIQDSPNRPQSLILNVDQMRAEYSTASPMSLPWRPSSRSTSSSSYSPLMWGTLMVMRMSVFCFSSRRSVRMMAVKSGAEVVSRDWLTWGVCVEMRVYAGVPSLEGKLASHDS